MPANKSRFASYQRILSYLGPYRGPFIAALICMVVFGASDGAVPFLVKRTLDGVFAERDKSLLILIPAILMGFALLRAACDFGQQYLTSKIGHQIVRDLRTEINRKVLSFSPSFFVEHSSADLLSRVTGDVLLVRTLLTDPIAAIIRDSIRVVALLVAAIYLDPFLALVAFVVFPIGVYPVYRFGRRMRRLSRQSQEAVGTLSGMMQESMIGNRVVKGFGRESFEEQRFDAENENLTRTLVKSEKIRAISGPLNEVLASFAISGIILYGGYSVISGVRSQGDFIAFLLSVFLLYDPFKKLSRVNGTVQQGMAGAERIFEILDIDPAIRSPQNPVKLNVSNRIELNALSFKYPTADNNALSDINITVSEGQKIALVGFSGSGKSTLVDLLPRFIDPSTGTVKIGGVDVRNVALEELRQRIAVVGQHTFLFNDSILNNIAYGNEKASRTQIEDAARAAYAYDFVMALPQGFDTVVGESGLTLSGGERQRIAIARAILKNAPILILDEATASLDNRSEREVQSAIETLERDKTTIVIAHRLSTVRKVDCIYVMREGRVVEFGTHDELLSRQGEYSKLHSLQFDEKEGSDLDEASIN